MLGTQSLADQTEQHKQHSLDQFVQVLSHLNGLPDMPEIMSLKQTLGQQSQHIADLEARLAASETQESAHASTREKVIQLEATLAAKEDRILHLNSLLDKANVDTKDTRQALETKDNELHSLQSEVHKLEAIVNFQDQEHAQLNHTIAAKDDEIKQLHQGLASSDAELSHTKTLLAQLDAQIEHKNQELHSLRSGNELTFRQLLESQTQSMQQLFAQQTATTDALTQQIVELKQQVRLQHHLIPSCPPTPPTSLPVSPAASTANATVGWGMPGLRIFAGHGRTKSQARSQSQIVHKPTTTRVNVS
jgi:chromosome segregation ATPase